MRVTEKGQVTIPQEIRRKYGIGKESEVRFEEEDGRVFLVRETPPEGVYGKAAGTADAGLSTEEILRLTREIDE